MGQKMEASCPLVSDLFDQVIDEMVEDREGSCLKSARWERFVFQDKEQGLLLLNSLMKDEELPTKQGGGYVVFIMGVGEIAYCREDGEVRLRCVVGQLACSEE